LPQAIGVCEPFRLSVGNESYAGAFQRKVCTTHQVVLDFLAGGI